MVSRGRSTCGYITNERRCTICVSDFTAAWFSEWRWDWQAVIFFLVTSIFFMFWLKGWLIYDFSTKFMFCEIHGAKAEILMELEDSKLRIGANFMQSTHFLLNMAPSLLFTQLSMSALVCFIFLEVTRCTTERTV